MKTAKKSRSKRTTKKAAKRNPTKSKKAAKRNPTKSKKAAKRNPTKSKKAAKRNPATPVPATEFRIAGRAPKPETVSAARPLVLRELRTYEPVRVAPGRAYVPWLVRRMATFGMGDSVLLHTLVDLANKGKVRLMVDEDRRAVMSRPDVALCPTVGEAAEPLVWVDYR